MSGAPRLSRYRLLHEFQAGTLETEAFCAQFEHTYNLELDKTTLSPSETSVFGRLFEQTVMYSPFPTDRAEYPGYRSEEDIAQAAKIAIQSLGKECTNPMASE